MRVEPASRSGHGPPIGSTLRAAPEVPRYLVEPFRVEVGPDGPSVRVSPMGELDVATAGHFADRLRKIVGEGCRDVLVDLRGLTFMDCAGFGTILAWDRRATADAALFTIIDGPPAVQRVFDLLGVRDRLSFIEGSRGPAGDGLRLSPTVGHEGSS